MTTIRPDIHISNNYQIPGHTTEAVFETGIDSRLWPSLDKMKFDYHDQDPYLKQFGQVSLHLSLDSLPRQLAKFRNVHIAGQIDRIEPGKYISISGQNPGLADLGIDLSFSDNRHRQDEDLTTTIHYETNIELRNLLVRKLGKGILISSLNVYVPSFCEQYRDNVIDKLNRP